MYSYQKWPQMESLLKLLLEKYNLELILKNSNLNKIESYSDFQKKQKLKSNCNPLYSKLYYFFLKNNFEFMVVLFFTCVKLKKKLIKKLIFFGNHILKILYNFFFRQFFLKNCINNSLFESYNFKKTQKKFEAIGFAVFFHTTMILNKTISIEAGKNFLIEKDAFGKFIFKFLPVLSLVYAADVFVYKWGLYILCSVLHLKEANYEIFLKKNKKINLKNIKSMRAILLEDNLNTLVFRLSKTIVNCIFLNTNSKNLLLIKSLNLLKCNVYFSGAFNWTTSTRFYFFLFNTFKFEIVEKLDCYGDSIRNYFDFFFFKAYFRLSNILYYFKNKKKDIFCENFNFRYKKTVLDILQFGQHQNKYKKNFKSKYTVNGAFWCILSIFFQLKCLIVFYCKKKTNFFIWFVFLKKTNWYNHELCNYIFVHFFFFLFSRNYNKLKKSRIRIFVNFYLKSLLIYFNFRTRLNSFEHLGEYLLFKVNLLKIKKLLPKYQFLRCSTDLRCFLIKKLEKQFIYTKCQCFYKKSKESTLRRTADLTGLRNNQKRTNIIGNLLSDGKYFEIAFRISNGKLLSSKFFLGVLLFKSQNIYCAKKQFFLYLSFNPKNLKGWAYLGLIGTILKELRLSLHSYVKIISESYFDLHAYFNLSLLLFYKSRNRKKAHILIKNVIQKNNSWIVLKIYIDCSLDSLVYSWPNVLKGVFLFIVLDYFGKYPFQCKIFYRVLHITKAYFSKKTSFFKFLSPNINYMISFIFNFRKAKNNLNFFISFYKFSKSFTFRSRNSSWKTFLYKKIYRFFSIKKKTEYMAISYIFEAREKFFCIK